MIRFGRLMACVVGLAVATWSSALVAAPLPQQTQQTAREGAPVKVANRLIIVLRGPIAGFSAKERATGTMKRIEEALAAEQLPAVSTEQTPDGTRVLLGGKHAFLVTGVDIDELASETTQLVARAAVTRLQAALVERLEQQTPRYLAIAAGLAALATAVYGAILWLIFRVNRWAGSRLSAAAARHAEKLRVGGVYLLDISHVLLFTRRLISIAAWLLALVLASGWLTFALEQFPYSRPWGEQLEGNLLAIAQEIGLAMAGAVPGLLLVGVIILLARTLMNFAEVLFRRVEEGRLELGWIDADTARPTRRIFNFLLWVFALAVAYPYLPGAQTEAFKGVSVLVGLMVTVGASSVVGQAFNGLILMYARSFRRGDYVRIGDSEGTVLELGMFVTRIRTGLGEEISLPNSTVMATSTRNYSRAVPGTGYVVDTVVTIGYGAPWRQVHAMLEEAARRTKSISATPPPMVRQTALADFYVEYRLVAYTPAETPERRVDVLNQMHANIQDVFNENGVQIMSPHYMVDPQTPQLVPKQDWYAPPAQPPGKP